MKYPRLIDLLDSCFDGPQLLKLLHSVDEARPVVGDVAWDRPNHEVTRQVIEQLERHRLVNGRFFDAIAAARPNRALEIAEVRTLWMSDGPPDLLASVAAPQLGAGTGAQGESVRDDRVSVRASCVIPYPAARVYAAMRDSMVDIAMSMSVVAGCEMLYQRSSPLGQIAGYYWRHRFGEEVPYVGSFVGTLSPQWLDVILTSTLHTTWSESERLTHWTWNGPSFIALETMDVQVDGAGARVDVTTDYLTCFGRATRSRPLLGIMQGVWLGIRHLQPEFLNSNIKAYLQAVHAFLDRSP